MAQRVFLHVGAPQTGVRYLQRQVRAHRSALAGRGVFVPLPRRSAQYDAVADLRGGQLVDGAPEATWDDLVAEVASTEGTALVSEQLLCGADDDQIQRAVTSLAPAEVHVICTARDIARQIPAEWERSLRYRSTTSYQDFLEEIREDPDHWFWRLQDPTRVHARWSADLGEGAFHVLTVPLPGTESDRFWKAYAGLLTGDSAHPSGDGLPAGLAEEAGEPDQPLEREPLDVTQAEMLRRFNDQAGGRFRSWSAYRRASRSYLAGPAGGTGEPAAASPGPGAPPGAPGVPREDAGWVAERAEGIVRTLLAAVDRIDVVGNPVDLLVGTAAVTADAQQLPDAVSEGEMFAVALDGWVRQLQEAESGLVGERALKQARRAARVARRGGVRLSDRLSERVGVPLRRRRG